MARIFTIKRSEGGDIFFWNINANVGLNSPNNPVDVELVQFGYFAAALSPKVTPSLRPIFAAVTPGAAYTATRDDPLTVAILAHQKTRGGTQDGHVSVIKGETYDGTHTFMLMTLVNAMRDLQPTDFPRIDKHPRCPLRVQTSVRLSFFEK